MRPPWSADHGEDALADSLGRGADVISASRRVVLPPQTPLRRRILKHPHLRHHNRLVAGVVTANLMFLGYGLTHGLWWSSHGGALKVIVIAAQVNVALAVLLREQHVINLLYRLATRAPTTWPLKLRWTLSKVYHFGGLHVGAAVSGTVWYLIFVGSLTYQTMRDIGKAPAAILVVSYASATLLVVMVATALPSVRARVHDSFELTHRFAGWIALVLVWASTVLFVSSQRGGASVTSALLTAPTVWMLVVTTACIALPWLRLGKVPITVDRPSSHVALVGFNHVVTPFIGSVRPISRHPLLGWHSFATIPAPGRTLSGYRMAISRVGDWTGAFIDDPPSQVWVRGIPIAGMANISGPFKKVVYVTTGSGIGPTLPHLLAKEMPSHLVWVTRSPRRTYGDALVDEILAVQPDATIWNTDKHGKPDMLRLAYAAYSSSNAEAVICIANKEVTWQIVYGLESRGIPACGPIWDS
jgi:hypothetical protein